MSNWKYEDENVRIIANKHLRRRYMAFARERRNEAATALGIGTSIEERAQDEFQLRAKLLAHPERLEELRAEMLRLREEAGELEEVYESWQGAGRAVATQRLTRPQIDVRGDMHS